MTIAGEITHLFRETVHRALHDRWRMKEISHQLVQIGVGSLPIIAVSTAFAGFVVTNEIAWQMQISLGTVSMIPGVTGQFILRELAIAIAALLLVSKVGAAITAEIGSMKVTEQIDALRLLRIDPIHYLVVPRFIATIVSSACLTLVSAGITLACAIAMASFRYHFTWLEYVNMLRPFIGWGDLLCALVKGVVFGAVIPIVSCVFAFRCKGGAEGVGEATTQSVVVSTLIVISLDFVLTYFFSLVL